MNPNKLRNFGVNDLEETVSICGRPKPFYSCYHSMLQRVFDPAYHRCKPTYKGCSITEVWMSLKRFKKWYDKHYINGWHLDKDILFPGNKVYGPGFCCFVPPEINSLLNYHSNRQSKYGCGIRLLSNGKFQVYGNFAGSPNYLGTYPDLISARVSYVEHRLWVFEIYSKLAISAGHILIAQGLNRHSILLKGHLEIDE